MAVRLSTEQERIIIDGIKVGQSASQIMKNAAVSKGTVIRIHRHVQQVGHYKGFTVSGKAPPLDWVKNSGSTKNCKRRA